MDKYNTTIAVAVISTMLLSALFLTAPAFSLANLQMPQFNVAFAQAAENVVELEAEVLPNGQYAYRMVSHTVDGDDVADRYDEDATIPGPTIVINEGESLDITVTNSITGVDANLVVDGFDAGEIEAKPATGILPIATGMMPDDSKYYVANLLSSSISVIDMNTGEKIKDINLLEDYNPLALDLVLGGANSAIVDDGDGQIVVGALPIQTPVSPDGKYMVTANTLTATVVVTDTTTDEAVLTLGCDPGCHGVQFGAKDGGGYYAYVSSKFSNAMLVVDADPDGNDDLGDAAVVGRILLVDADNSAWTTPGSSVSDDEVSGLDGFGGQGVLAIPVVYNGWVQELPEEWKAKLSEEQLDPTG